MCAEHRVRDTFDRLASEYDELKLRVIPRYRQVQVSHSATQRDCEETCSRTRMRLGGMGNDFPQESSNRESCRCRVLAKDA
jgi:hypothetical protein